MTVVGHVILFLSNVAIYLEHRNTRKQISNIQVSVNGNLEKLLAEAHAKGLEIGRKEIK
jgi:hypothetical protein